MGPAEKSAILVNERRTLPMLSQRELERRIVSLKTERHNPEADPMFVDARIAQAQRALRAKT